MDSRQLILQLEDMDGVAPLEPQGNIRNMVMVGVVDSLFLQKVWTIWQACKKQYAETPNAVTRVMLNIIEEYCASCLRREFCLEQNQPFYIGKGWIVWVPATGEIECKITF